MARKTRRKKKSAARKPAVRRVKRRKSAKRSAVAPKRRKRRKVAKKTVAKKAPKRRKRKAKAAKASPRKRRRLRRNKGTRAGALKGWRTRKAKRKSAPKRRRSKARKSAPKSRRRKLSQSKSARKARAARRRAKSGLKPNKRRSRRRVRRNARRLSPNRRTRRTKRVARRSLARRTSRRRYTSNKRRGSRRRLRRNGRSMFRKNGILDPILFVAKTGGIALGGLLAHKLVSNFFTTQVLNRVFGSPAAVVSTPAATTVVAPATAGLGGLNLDPSYQRLIGSFLVAAGGVFATAKLVKDQTTRNTIMTGIAVSFMHTGFSALLTKFAPQYTGLLAGPEDGTAARLSAMYGLGAGTSIQPRYAAISGGVGEYFSSTNGLGEYFDSGVNGLGEYFSSGVNGLGAAYEAAAGYGSNPDLMEAAAGMGSASAPTNHVDPHGDLDRELTIAEAAAGVGGMGAVQSYEASAGFGNISSLPSASTWIPGTTDGQIWAGTRAISAPQSASEMVPAGILQTDGGQGVFG